MLRESDSVSPDDVLDFVDRIRPLLTDEAGAIDIVMGLVRAEVPWERLYPEDRVLVNYLFQIAEQRLGERNTEPSDINTDALTILGWIEQAAILSGGEL